MPVEKEDYWELFRLSGLPEAWMMSHPERGDLNGADRTAKAVPHRDVHLPAEAQKLYEKELERGTAQPPAASLSGE